MSYFKIRLRSQEQGRPRRYLLNGKLAAIENIWTLLQYLI